MIRTARTETGIWCREMGFFTLGTWRACQWKELRCQYSVNNGLIKFGPKKDFELGVKKHKKGDISKFIVFPKRAGSFFNERKGLQQLREINWMGENPPTVCSDHYQNVPGKKEITDSKRLFSW